MGNCLLTRAISYSYNETLETFGKCKLVSRGYKDPRTTASWTYTNGTGHTGTFILIGTRDRSRSTDGSEPTWYSPSTTTTTSGGTMRYTPNGAGWCEAGACSVYELPSGKSLTIGDATGGGWGNMSYAVFELVDANSAAMTGLTCTKKQYKQSLNTTGPDVSTSISNGVNGGLYVVIYEFSYHDGAIANIGSLNLTNCSTGSNITGPDVFGRNRSYGFRIATCIPTSSTNTVGLTLSYSSGWATWSAGWILQFTKTVSKTGYRKKGVLTA